MVSLVFFHWLTTKRDLCSFIYSATDDEIEEEVDSSEEEEVKATTKTAAKKAKKSAKAKKAKPEFAFEFDDGQVIRTQAFSWCEASKLTNF